jgi:MoaA/NifB/PqqE/SkfB family radical SAM enzyme
VSFEVIRRVLGALHAKGARYLYLQGGEPFVWRDGGKRLGDVVEEAKRAGFFHVTVCTNGTYRLDAEPDTFSLSIEGCPEHHDAIRCGTYARVMENVAASMHQRIFINATFNRINGGDLDDLAELARSSSHLQGLLVNFHIPYPGVEHLALPAEQRRALALRALELKRKGFPILNTSDGLRALARNDWKRPLDFSVVTDGTTFYSCCRARGQEQICAECGYAGWAELAQVYAWNWRSIPEVLMRLNQS